MGRKLSKYLKNQFRYRKTKRTNYQGTIGLIKSVYHRSSRFLITYETSSIRKHKNAETARKQSLKKYKVYQHICSPQNPSRSKTDMEKWRQTNISLKLSIIP